MSGPYQNHNPPPYSNGSGQYTYPVPYGSQPGPTPTAPNTNAFAPALGQNAPGTPFWPQQGQPPQPPTPNGQASTKDGTTFSLHIEQQPNRARMCGFGDKDRRPIGPPPMVKLNIEDERTGKEVKIDELRAQHYVLMVDLFDKNGEREVNLVRHANAQPSVSISMSTPTAYPPSPEQPQVVTWMTGNGPAYSYAPPNWANMPGYNLAPQGSYGMPQVVPQPPHNSNMFTRNLIGSVTVSATILKDLDGKEGVWFVLQDLSVRQEGTFRLKITFIDVGGTTPGTLSMGTSPVLATAFSEPFSVYSAKKFPGVLESTELSKHFAAQGVKIPIRKDSSKGASAAGDGDDDD